MALQESLRSLVLARGVEVLADADEFRAALDDYLAEEEATRGEVNLLVDTVRLGALGRLWHLLDQGGDPRVAVATVADELARDRGTDDPARPRWALAVLTYAGSRFDEEQVRRALADAGTAPTPSAPPPARSPAPAPPPAPDASTSAEPRASASSRASRDAGQDAAQDAGTVPLSSPQPDAVREVHSGARADPDADPDADSDAERRAPHRPDESAPTQVLSPASAVDPGPPLPPAVAPPPWQEAPGGSGRPESRGVAPAERRTGVMVAGVLAVLVLVVGGGWWFVSRGDEPSARDPGAGADESRTSDVSAPRRSPTSTAAEPIAASVVLVPVTDEEGDSRIVEVDVDDGTARAPLGDTEARLPNLAHDRTRWTVLVDAPGGGRSVSAVVDGELVPLFDDAGPCRHAARPAWSTDDTRLAVICTDAAGEATGLYVADAPVSAGDLPLEAMPLVSDPTVEGTPTWTGEDTVVYSATTGPGVSRLFAVEASGGDPTPFGDVDDGYVTHATYSPEADAVLALHGSVDSGTYGELWRYQPDGTGARRLGVAGGPYGSPVWSPDGERIAFLLQTEDGPRLAVAPASDPADAKVVEVDGVPGVPAWASR